MEENSDRQDILGNQSIHLLIERRQRIRIAFVVVPGFLGLLMIFLTTLFGEGFVYGFGIRPQLVLLIGLILLTLSGTSILMIYLQTGFKKHDGAEEAIYIRDTGSSRLRKQFEELVSTRAFELSKFSAEVDSLRSDLARLTSSSFGIDEKQRLAIVQELRSTIRQETADSVIADIEKKVQASYEQRERDRVIESHFEELRSRLMQEITALGRRGNLNLALGIATTIAGLVILGIFVFSSTSQHQESWQFAANFIPRLTLVVFIETFAYFFLSLYKASLTEIKYFQNELTNVEAQCIALRTCIALGDNATMKEVVGKICCTERNFILSKNQTTADLERARLEKNVFAEATKLIAGVFPKKS